MPASAKFWRGNINDCAKTFKSPGFGGAFQRFIGLSLGGRSLGAQDGIWLARINQALKAMPPMSGRFEQKLPNGGHAGGRMPLIGPTVCASPMKAAAALSR